MLEILAKRFSPEIPKVWKLLTKFEEARDELYKQVLVKILSEKPKND